MGEVEGFVEKQNLFVPSLDAWEDKVPGSFRSFWKKRFKGQRKGRRVAWIGMKNFCWEAVVDVAEQVG